MSIVSLLAMHRTSFPVAPRVYVSNSPEYNGIMVDLWDTREWATVLAVLDPQMHQDTSHGAPQVGFSPDRR